MEGFSLIFQIRFKMCKNKILVPFSIFVLLFFFFWSSCLSGLATDFVGFSDIIDHGSNRNHFLDSELYSYMFSEKKLNGNYHICSDIYSSAYLEKYLKLHCFNFDLSHEGLPPKSYLIFRNEAYESSGELTFSIGELTNKGFFNGISKTIRKNEGLDPISILSKNSLNYNCGTVYIYLNESNKFDPKPGSLP
jgi:hypothetical protein